MSRIKQIVEERILPGPIQPRLVAASRPYLITGSHTAFQYHRWLSPTTGLVGLRVYPKDLPWWQDHLACAGVHVSLEPPTRQDVMEGIVVTHLKPDLAPALYARRQVIQGMTFESAEDLCLDLLARAKGESAYAEAAAILVNKRDALDWPYLIEQAAATDQAMALGIVAEIANREAGCELVPQAVIEQLMAASHPVSTFPAHPSRRWAWRQKAEERESGSYPESSARWDTRVLLPRHVVGKVVFDLRPRWASR